ncbi:unnamed protein product [Heterobilharzia americana]|nr:unnamed protein product [Heterobilharzia americana]
MQQPNKTDKPNIVYKINWNNCSKHYIEHSGRPLHLHLHEHQLTTKRHDMSSLLISMHVDKNYGDELNFDIVEILEGERKDKEYERIPRSLAFTSVSQSVSEQSIDV